MRIRKERTLIGHIIGTTWQGTEGSLSLYKNFPKTEKFKKLDAQLKAYLSTYGGDFQKGKRKFSADSRIVLKLSKGECYRYSVLVKTIYLKDVCPELVSETEIEEELC